MKSVVKSKTGGTYKIEASQERSQKRIKEILQSAQHILITEGFQGLSLRRIAQHMGISNGNLTYYFANKKMLLRALIEDQLARYDHEFEKEAKKFPNDADKRIYAYFNYLIKDAQTADSRNFFYQLWGLSIHSSIAAELRDEVYQRFLLQVMAQLAVLRPELSNQELRNKSFLLMSLMEGANVLFGSGNTYLKQFHKTPQLLLDQVKRIIHDP